MQALRCKPMRATTCTRSIQAAPLGRRGARLVRRAEEPGSSVDTSPSAANSTPPQPATPAPPAAAAAPDASNAPVLAKGQGTAIITGAISLLFGVAYLVVTALLDMRGGELLPPPPEAFIP